MLPIDLYSCFESDSEIDLYINLQNYHGNKNIIPFINLLNWIK